MLLVKSSTRLWKQQTTKMLVRLLSPATQLPKSYLLLLYSNEA